MNYLYKSKTLERLGVRSWINASNWSTIYGGSWTDDRVLDCMNEVAKTFVDMHDLLTKAGQRVAELCNVDVAYITCGAGAGIELSVTACMAGDNANAWKSIPNTAGLKNEVALPLGHYTGYLPQWGASGASIIGYGQAGSMDLVTRNDIEGAITDQTCCLGYVESYNVVPRGKLPLSDVVEIAHKYELPVIVDAASMVPPVSNLQKYSDLGADIVIFSGGKATKGPNNTGMILGKGPKGKELVEAILKYAFPNDGWGRSLKVSKEQIVGLVVALEIFVKEGDSYYREQMKTAQNIAEELSQISNVEICIIPNDEKFHEHPIMPHVPRVKIEWDMDIIKLTPSELDKALTIEDPPIFLRASNYYSYHTNKPWRIVDTYFLRQGDVKIIIDRLKKIFNNYS